MPPWTKVGAVPGDSQLAVSSDDGKYCTKRGSRRLRSTMLFSLTQELYCWAVASMVLALRITSCCHSAAERDTPRMRLASGGGHSVDVTFWLTAPSPVAGLGGGLGAAQKARVRRVASWCGV